MAAGEDETVTFGWPLILKKPLGVEQGGTGSASAQAAVEKLGAVSKSGDTMTGNLYIQEWLYPSLFLKPTIGDTTNQVVFEGSYLGAASFSAWEDDTGNDRRMLEVRTADYEPSLDNAVMMRSVISGDYSEYRVFHSGMDSPIPVENGGTGGSNGKEA